MFLLPPPPFVHALSYALLISQWNSYFKKLSFAVYRTKIGAKVGGMAKFTFWGIVLVSLP